MEQKWESAGYEQELVAAHVTPDQFDQETGRLYPNVMGNGHPDVCMCPSCAPGEYAVPDEEMDVEVEGWRAFLEAGGFEGMSDEAIRALIRSCSTENG